jgi:dethiobiotin synthetase
MAKGVFITATDTGVGKTIAAAAIIRALKGQGIKVGAMKPIETGCMRHDGVLIPSDGRFLKKSSGMDDSLDLITPVRFELPLAPHIASQREGVAVELGKVFDAYRVLSSKYDFMVVEGIGGVLVPLAGKTTGNVPRTYFVVDLINDLKLPAVVVTRPALGTINHTLLTVSHLLNEGVDVVGIIISFSTPAEGTIAETTNAQALKELCPVPVIGVIPWLRATYPEAIESDAKGCIDFEALIPHS